MPEYRIVEGSLQEEFHASRAKIQLFGGGFGNGKTAASCIKILRIAREYSGCNIVVCRETKDKVNDTIRKELLKWCPKSWIKSFNRTNNVLTMKNDSTINFRHLRQDQRGKGEEATSNLLSATYDLIVVDQVEDPGITRKDFDDLMGRLRGTAEYIGDDPTMPKTGPRWVILTCNPTSNWVYKQLVKPIHDHRRGVVNNNLICKTKHGVPVIKDGMPIPNIDLFEGSTHTNADNLPEDFIEGLEATYKGQMRKRFLGGEWGAYEGLIYNTFEAGHHVVNHAQVDRYMRMCRSQSSRFQFIEGFDFGIASPSCYLLGFVDHLGNVSLLDGFYESELSDHAIIERITTIRSKYNITRQDTRMYADPAIFKRVGGTGETVSDRLQRGGIRMQQANNQVMSGITKVQSYLHKQKNHINPYTKQIPGAYLYISTQLTFLEDELGTYRWKTQLGVPIDEPVKKDDHAVDAMRYLLTGRPIVTKLARVARNNVPAYLTWGEAQISNTRNSHRYG